jgi:hypothetical protein
MKKYPYLDEAESQAVEMLADGQRLREIQQAVSATVEKRYFYMFLATLRRKTGIEDTQSIPECSAYRSHMEKLSLPVELSKRQAILLENFSKSWPYFVSAGRMGISEAEAKEETEAALAAIGITTQDPRTRRAQVRMYFAAHGNPNNVLRPPSPIHLRILRAIADGIDPNSLPGLERADIRILTKEACQRINASSPGRNAQRKLVQAYLSSQTQDPMDDPLF